MSAKDEETGGPAFPGQRVGSDGKPECEATDGMMLRDYFAAAALTGLCSATDTNGEWGVSNREGCVSEAARIAYAMAGAMIRARKEPQP